MASFFPIPLSVYTTRTTKLTCIFPFCKRNLELWPHTGKRIRKMYLPAPAPPSMMYNFSLIAVYIDRQVRCLKLVPTFRSVYNISVLMVYYWRSLHLDTRRSSYTPAQYIQRPIRAYGFVNSYFEWHLVLLCRPKFWYCREDLSWKFLCSKPWKYWPSLDRESPFWSPRLA